MKKKVTFELGLGGWAESERPKYPTEMKNKEGKHAVSLYIYVAAYPEALRGRPVVPGWRAGASLVTEGLGVSLRCLGFLN